jgi:hypothetical protein
MWGAGCPRPTPAALPGARHTLLHHPRRVRRAREPTVHACESAPRSLTKLTRHRVGDPAALGSRAGAPHRPRRARSAARARVLDLVRRRRRDAAGSHAGRAAEQGSSAAWARVPAQGAKRDGAAHRGRAGSLGRGRRVGGLPASHRLNGAGHGGQRGAPGAQGVLARDGDPAALGCAKSRAAMGLRRAAGRG